MARIVLCSREWSTTTGRYVRELVHYLQEVDRKNEYFVLIKPEDMDSWTPTNPNFHKVACPHKEYSFDEQLGLKKQIESLKPDLVHFTMVQQPILYKGNVVTTMQDLTTLRFKNPSKNPIIFTIKQFVYGWVNKVAAKKSTLIITPTKFVKQDVIDYTKVAADKVRVTYEAADPLVGEATPFKPLANKKFIMYIGRPNPHKNLPRLINAFILLQTTHPELRLVLAGKLDAVYNKIKDDVESRGLKNVIFTDYITDGQLKWLYNHTSAYVFPSLSEGFGLPALEAMIHSAPVASSNATCLPEVYQDAALYFDPYREGEMASTIAHIIDNDSEQKRLIKKGTALAKQYSWKKMAKETLDVYNEALSQ